MMIEPNEAVDRPRVRGRSPRPLAPMTTAKRAVIVWYWRMCGPELICRRGARPADTLVSWWRGFWVIGP